MSEGLAVFILMNNYFHDVATAMLLASGIAMWMIVKNIENRKDKAVMDYFMNLSQSVKKIGRFSLYWILLGGIPRIFAFKDFELAHAISKNQVSGLIVKHMIAFLFVTAGTYVWIKINARIKNLRDNE